MDIVMVYDCQSVMTYVETVYECISTSEYHGLMLPMEQW